MKSQMFRTSYLLMMPAIFAAGYLLGSSRSHDTQVLRPVSLPAGEKPVLPPEPHALPRKTGHLIV